MSEKANKHQVSHINHTWHGEGLQEPLPTNFEASQLCQEPFIGSILHLNLVTWVPLLTLTQKVHQKIFYTWATQLVMKCSKKTHVMYG